ncbi:MAG: hypothetical protein KAI44_00220 [Methylococcales bacterium]|nr:hypothetical protein [Methylococcales bacterium]MCK5477317.1 hypothetical protein [Methylococcales bacterium]
MRHLTGLVILLIPVIAIAQNPADFGFDQQQMQAMMQKGQEMQACMKNIDQTEMQAFEQKGRKMEAEVKELCAAGKRAEALSKAMAFGKEVMNSSAMQQMKKCGEMMQGMMPGVTQFSKDYENDDSQGHVCDNFN